MNLTKDEKRKIFWALVKEYPEHDRGRKQAHQFFGGRPEKLTEIMENINDVEFSAYLLIKKFADELGETIPEYSEPMPSGNYLEKKYNSETK